MRQAFEDQDRDDDGDDMPGGYDTGETQESYIDDQGRAVHRPPKKEWQGCWAPPELFRLLERGRINGKEFVLLLVIGNYVRHGNSPRGCYASNAYLARIVHLKSAETIRRMLHRLKRKGLVRQLSFDGKTRFLDTKFAPVKPWKRID